MRWGCAIDVAKCKCFSNYTFLCYLSHLKEPIIIWYYCTGLKVSICSEEIVIRSIAVVEKCKREKTDGQPCGQFNFQMSESHL